MKSAGNNSLGLTAAMVALAPLLLAQGIYVRRTAPRLPEPQGPREGQDGEGKPLRLLMLGDSAGAGVGVRTWQETLCAHIVSKLRCRFRLRWKLLARTGNTARDLLLSVHTMPPEPFDAVAMTVGVNDVTGGRRPSTWLRQLHKLVDELRSRLGVCHVIFAGLPPMESFPALPQPLRWYLGARARQFDRALKSWAKSQDGCEFMPLSMGACPGMMATDGYHPGPVAYAVFGAEVARRIIGRWA